MLIEFRVENHRSIRDEQVLSMEAGRVGDDADTRPRTVKGYAEKLLPVAALYGANASGKSNVLSALEYVQRAVLNSHRYWGPAEGVPREPFAWGPRSDEPSLFEIAMVIGETRYQYGFAATAAEFCEEWLFAWPRGKKQTWFTRADGAFKIGESLKGETKLIEGMTRKNSLFLSSAAQNNHEQLTNVYSWFRALRTINVRHRHIGDVRIRIARLLDEKNAPRYRAMLRQGEPSPEFLVEGLRELIKVADFGISNVRVSWTETSSAGAQVPQLQFQHSETQADAWLPFEDESRGTQTFLDLSLPILRALRDGDLLIVDELESSLHPELSRKIVELFNNPATNPHNAQLIFTTHETNLLGNTLGEPVLRRDQVWFTEKAQDGATTLYPLTNYVPRKAENLERGYLLGRYGATPFLGDASFVGS